MFLYILSIIICVPFGLCFWFTYGREKTFNDREDTLFKKFLNGIHWIFILLKIILAIIIPFINIILVIWYSLQLINGKDNKLSDMAENLHYELPPPIDIRLNKIENKYKFIVNGDINKELAKNRFEYVLTVLKESSQNELFENMSQEYFNNIVAMMDSVDTFFDEIIRGIKESKNITNKLLEEYMKDKIKEFTSVTKSMEDDFKKMNKNFFE